MGYEVCSIPEFNAYCDKWDSINHFPPHHSKSTFAFYNNGGPSGTENLFGFVLQSNNLSIQMVGYDFHHSKPAIPADAIGLICFNTRHTWAVRKHTADGKWWVHDSLRTPFQYRHRSTNRYCALYCFNK